MSNILFSKNMISRSTFRGRPSRFYHESALIKPYKINDVPIPFLSYVLKCLWILKIYVHRLIGENKNGDKHRNAVLMFILCSYKISLPDLL